MIFQRVFWYRIAIVAVVLNVAGFVAAAVNSEPMHAFLHGVAAVGFGLWARHLRRGSLQRERQADRPDQVALLEANVSDLERELRETKERLEFADQLLRKKPPSS